LIHLIRDILPVLDEYQREYRILVAGNIDKKSDMIPYHPSIEYLGEYENIDEIHKISSISIIPIIYGSGLKIKTIDALCSAKCVITYPAGIDGLPAPDANSPYCKLVESPEEFAEAMFQLSTIHIDRNQIENNALKFIKEYNDKNTINNYLH